MKKHYTLYALLICMLAGAFTSCSEDDLNPASVITTGEKVENDFDRWLVANYVNPYNIAFNTAMKRWSPTSTTTPYRQSMSKPCNWRIS